MSFNIEDQLFQIDQSFAEKSEGEVYMIYALVAGVLIFLSYYFLWDSAKLGYDNALKASKALEKKIAQDNSYLSSHPVAMIAQIENQTKALEAEFVAYQDSNAYIKFQIEQISSLYYDEEAWGEYLDSIAENAKKYKIKLNLFTNQFASNKDAFGHVLDIQVQSEGKFHNMVRYINSLEQSFLVVDIHNLALKAEPKKLGADLNISVWGITY